MMNWDSEWGDHMNGAWSWVGGAMMILWIVLLALGIFALVTWLIRSSGTPGSGGSSDDARSVLDRRYAAGEIDDETYRSMRDRMSSSAV